MSLAWLLGQLIETFTSGILLLLFWLGGGLFVGSGFAVNNWLAFRTVKGLFDRQTSGRWFVATIAAWAISLAAVSGAGLAARYGLVVAGLVIGSTVGLLQWSVIRSRFVYSWTWIPGQLIAWVIAAALMNLFSQAVGFILAGLVSGAISGAMLIWLIRKNPFENSL